MDETHPSHPEFWNSRYRSGETPWDFGGMPADLKEFLRPKNKQAPASQLGNVLIPGCGTGHEIEAFADAGYEVTAIDLSPVAVELARKKVGPTLADCVLQGDFFQHDLPLASFDLIYERNFLCALMPDRRGAYRDRMAQLLKRGGALAGYFYYQRTAPDDGPPFGLAWGEADELFSRFFLLTKDIPVNDSLPLVAGRERWQVRRRNSAPVAAKPA